MAMPCSMVRSILPISRFVVLVISEYTDGIRCCSFSLDFLTSFLSGIVIGVFQIFEDVEKCLEMCDEKEVERWLEMFDGRDVERWKKSVLIYTRTLSM